MLFIALGYRKPVPTRLLSAAHNDRRANKIWAESEHDFVYRGSLVYAAYVLFALLALTGFSNSTPHLIFSSPEGLVEAEIARHSGWALLTSSG